MIELALTPDFRWSVDVDDLVAGAQRAGFSAVGIRGEDANTAAAAALTRTGLRCHEVLALMIGPDEKTNFAQAEQLAIGASAISAAAVVATFVAPLSDTTERIVRRCAAIIAEAGAKLAVEFTPFGEVSSIPAALAIADLAGTECAGVLIDTWHFFRSGAVWEDLEAIPLDRITHVQFDDAPEPISDNGTHETINRRVMPGDGGFALERFASTLLDRGWDGVVSVEVLNKELRTLPVDEFAALAYAHTVPYWR
jgi:sugar phosphate isomerase/epimerase